MNTAIIKNHFEFAISLPHVYELRNILKYLKNSWTLSSDKHSTLYWSPASKKLPENLPLCNTVLYLPPRIYKNILIQVYKVDIESVSYFVVVKKKSWRRIAFFRHQAVLRKSHIIIYALNLYDRSTTRKYCYSRRGELLIRCSELKCYEISCFERFRNDTLGIYATGFIVRRFTVQLQRKLLNDSYEHL